MADIFDINDIIDADALADDLLSNESNVTDKTVKITSPDEPEMQATPDIQKICEQVKFIIILTACYSVHAT